MKKLKLYVISKNGKKFWMYTTVLISVKDYEAMIFWYPTSPYIWLATSSNNTCFVF